MLTRDVPRHTAIAESDRLDIMQAQIDDLRAQVAALQQARPRPSLSRADREQLERLLPVVAGVLGSGAFLARELLVSDHPALRLVLRGLNAKQLGRLFRRGCDQPIGGFVVRRAGTEGNATLWSIERVF